MRDRRVENLARRAANGDLVAAKLLVRALEGVDAEGYVAARACLAGPTWGLDDAAPRDPYERDMWKVVRSAWNPPSSDRRRLERLAARGDFDAKVHVLADRLRRGDVSPEQVRLAAELGDPRASRLMPVGVGRSLPGSTEIQAVGFALGDEEGLAVAFAADCLEHLAPGPRAMAIVEAARLWVRDRSEESRAVVATARVDVYAEMRKTRSHGDGNVRMDELDVADWLGQAVQCAGGKLLDPRPGDVSRLIWSAWAAARDAARVAEVDGGGAAKAEEEDWQRARLAAYALGEVRVPRPLGNPRGDRRRLERLAARGDPAAKARVECADPQRHRLIRYTGRGMSGAPCGPACERAELVRDMPGDVAVLWREALSVVPDPAYVYVSERESGEWAIGDNFERGSGVLVRKPSGEFVWRDKWTGGDRLIPGGVEAAIGFLADAFPYGDEA